MTAALGNTRTLFVALGVLLGAFLLLPIAFVVAASVTSGQFLSFPPRGVSMRWYDEVLSNSEWHRPFFVSIRLSFFGALVATVTGTAGALALRRLRLGASWLRLLFIAPIVLPYVVYALGMYNVVDSIRGIGNPLWIVLGQGAIAFPLVFVTVSGGLALVGKDVTRAAESLGASWWTIVWRVELPMVRASVAGASLLAFIYCFDELMVPLFLGGPELVPFSVQIYRSIRESVSPAVAAASVLLIVVAVAVSTVSAVMIQRANRALAKGVDR